jgi:Sulfotransferase family
MARRHRPPDRTPESVRLIVRRATKYLYRRYHIRSTKLALAGRIANLDDAEAFLREGGARLKIPLIMISQVQRSGGTLLSQLFDGHPQLCAYPQELKFDFPESDSWPELDPDRGVDWNFSKLFDRNFPQQVRRGFTKGDRDPTRHAFMLISRVQYGLFAHWYATQRPSNSRAILDLFFSSFFNAWLNYQGDLHRKRWITAFAPRLANHEVHMERFFSDYPDGRLIQIVRNPKSWYPSAKNHAKLAIGKKGAEHIVSRWCVSAESMLRNRSRYGDRVAIVRFEDMVGCTEETMRTLCDKLEIAWNQSVTVPTFNGELMRANSSFAVESTGVIQAPLNREAMLSQEECELFDKRCLALYEKVVGEALSISSIAPVRAVGGKK